MGFAWVWVGILIAAIVVELLTDQLIAIWFAPGAVIGIITDYFNLDVVWQIGIFLVVSAVAIFVSQKYLRKFTRAAAKTNIEAIIGEKCIVTERIDNFAGVGQVKIKGQIWSARGVEENAVFEPGEILSIVAIEGVKLICKK